MNYGGIHPAVVHSYEPGSRFCMVSIPGVTDGANGFIEAEIGQNIGDKSEHTEIRILAGDRVWVMFMGGDPKHPIITHFRAKAAGNEVGTRRFHHENIETDADETQKHTAGTTYRIEVGATEILADTGNITKKADGQITNDSPLSRVTQALIVGHGATGTFTTPTGNIVTVENGIVTNIF